MRVHNRRLTEHPDVQVWLEHWHRELVSRRQFLQRMAGGTLAALFPLSVSGSEAPPLDDVARWKILDAVQHHMLPSEPDAPGAGDLASLEYLRFVVSQEQRVKDEPVFMMQGAGWLEDIAKQLKNKSFTQLDEKDREEVLRRIEQSEAGENWLALVLYYLIEGMLADPVYGSNRDQLGWQWLQHIPGFPRPPENKRYTELRKR
jgi:gluconate 2-dehydrogenase gamma chain